MTTKTGGYAFVKDEEVLLCETNEDYIDGFRKFLSVDERNRIASAAYKKAVQLLSEEAVKKIMHESVERVTSA